MFIQLHDDAYHIIRQSSIERKLELHRVQLQSPDPFLPAKAIMTSDNKLHSSCTRTLPSICRLSFGEMDHNFHRPQDRNYGEVDGWMDGWMALIDRSNNGIACNYYRQEGIFIPEYFDCGGGSSLIDLT